MMNRALSLVLIAVLLVSAVCFMAPSAKATSILINGDFESGSYPWGSPILSSDAFEGSYSCSLFSPLTVYQDYSYGFLPVTNYNLSLAYKTNGTFDIVPFFVFPPSYNGMYLRRFTNGTWINFYSGAFSVVSNYLIGDWNITLLSIQTSESMYSGTWRFMVIDTVESNVDLKIDNIILDSGNIEIGGVVLNTPVSGSTVSSLNVTFTYTPILSLPIQNASLWLNSYSSWTSVMNNASTVVNGSSNSFSYYILPYAGVYFWNVRIHDINSSYFAPANYSLTVNSTSINYGSHYNSCENADEWINVHGANHYVNYTDYKEGYGSTLINNTHADSANRCYIMLTDWGNATNQVLGAWIKANSGLASFEWYDTDGHLRGVEWLSNSTIIFATQTGNSEQVDCTGHDWLTYGEWHWWEVRTSNVGLNVRMWMDGHVVWEVNTGDTTYNVSRFEVRSGYGANTLFNMQVDFLRLADAEEYPVYLTSTINVVSNPELNAFFSMATNASSLQTETLCVDGNVSEQMDELSHVGTYPWLDTQDDNTSYVQTNLATATYDQYYTFNDTTFTTLASVTMHVRLACFPISTVVGVLVQVYLWNGSSYVGIEGFQRFGDWLTMNRSTLFSKGFNNSAMLNQMRLKIWMNLNQQVPELTYFGRLTAIWMDVYGYGSPEGYAIHQTPYSFNPTNATYIFQALNSTLYSSGQEYSFSGFNYTTGSYVGTTLILTSLSGITNIILEYSVVPPPGIFLFPFLFLFWVIGLFCLFLSPIYAIDKIKKREYLVGMVGGVILGAIGFGLFIGGLWGITI